MSDVVKRTQQVNALLDKAVQEKKFLYYNEIETQTGVLKASYELRKILGDRMELDQKLGQPLASSMVINVNGAPGDGYWAQARELGFTFRNKLQFWQEQVSRVVAS